MIYHKLTNNDKLIIAEFIYAFNTDTLIKSEGDRVIDLFKKYGINNDTRLEAFSIYNLIKINIEPEQRKQIMEDYYSGNI